MNAERENSLGWRIMAATATVSSALVISVLATHWPSYPEQRPPTADEVFDALEAAGRAAASRRKTHPTDPDRLLRGDLEAIRRYAFLTPQQFGSAGHAWAAAPRKGDWRAGPGRHEQHQDFLEYRGEQDANRRPEWRTLVLRPVGRWPLWQRELPALLSRFVSTYFQRPVRWGDSLALPQQRRLNNDGVAPHLQYLTRPVMQRLKRERPSDALAVMALAHRDLYPSRNWGFVFGLADLVQRVGVVSTARVFPRFWGARPTEDARRLGLRRLLKLLAHELGHMLGLGHCKTFSCTMNGCRGLAELDRQPLHLCPLCQAKLAWRLALDLPRRFAELSELLHRLELFDEARWFERQAVRLASRNARGSGDASDSAQRGY